MDEDREEVGSMRVPDDVPDTMVRYGKYGWVTAERLEEIKQKQRVAGLRTQEILRTKKASQTNSTVHLPVELPQDERERLQEANYQDLIRWVVENVDKKECPAGVPSMARALWDRAKEDPGAFVDKYLPVLMKKQDQEGRLPGVPWDGEGYFECPTCGAIHNDPAKELKSEIYKNLLGISESKGL